MSARLQTVFVWIKQAEEKQNKKKGLIFEKEDLEISLLENPEETKNIIEKRMFLEDLALQTTFL